MLDMPCVCPLAGHCGRFGRVMSEREHQVCQGIKVSPRGRAVCLRSWSNGKIIAWPLTEPRGGASAASVPSFPQAAAATPQKAPAKVPAGPGTELKKLLTSLGARTCGSCAEYAAQMDSWGIEGCRQRRAEIVERLRDMQRRTSWSAKTMLGLRALVSGTASLTDPLGHLVDLAMEAAAKHEAGHKEG